MGGSSRVSLGTGHPRKGRGRRFTALALLGAAGLGFGVGGGVPHPQEKGLHLVRLKAQQAGGQGCARWRFYSQQARIVTVYPRQVAQVNAAAGASVTVNEQVIHQGKKGVIPHQQGFGLAADAQLLQRRPDTYRRGSHR